MSVPISMGAARAMMGDRILSSSEDMLVPFMRGELFEARRANCFLFCIPAGSFRTFPNRIEQIHVDSDIEDVSREAWTYACSPATFILAHPSLYPGTVGLPIWEQEKCVLRQQVLTPYEIACMSALYKATGKGRLFTGCARTYAQMGTSVSHLHTYPLTAILSFDAKENLRINRGYTSQVASNLGVLAGTRRQIT